MKAMIPAPALLALAMATALGTAAPAAAALQPKVDAAAEECQRRGRSTPKAEPLYPQATREAPSEGASQRMGQRLNKLGEAFEKEQYAEVRELADAIIAEERANDYDKAYAAQLAANAAYSEDDSAAAIAYLQQAVEFDALDNNGHFQSMLMLAQLQAQEEQTDASLATLDRYLQETQSDKADDLALKGQLLYQAERYAEAIPALKAAIEASENPNGGWVQALMASYAETGQTAEATALGEEMAAKTPGDKRAQINLASMYMQAEQMDKAIEVLEKLRAEGQLTEDREYRNLFALHLNTEGGEQKAIEVINDGLQKGVLEENHQTYVALAQAHYFSEQTEPAIEAYRKAAPLDEDGETYLNLAKVLAGEGRDAEAKEAAQQALDKGLARPQEATQILSR
ncbi:tetratricopeptide repeat protein [Luteimonas sp. RD2P54]|uniref:Tetratricopeptide repeat protein n=1 Tax=Luteimonas endophytica TaxID=3042023 RepID=A0ABT6J705_9GAMM|nr:tetratricopeptide repeat protein [Luteimonas endophytica]MDH5822611.1 tetratricopeptide repeat protein [Luteimonas endophytica]